jgi:hypothetical protein
MLFIHNHSLLHDRTAFVDYSDEEIRTATMMKMESVEAVGKMEEEEGQGVVGKRHLLRSWMATPSARPLPAVFALRFGSVCVGDRGGIDSPGVTPVAFLMR